MTDDACNNSVVSALQTTSRLASLASVSLLLGTFGLVHHESNRVQAVLHTKPFDSELGLLNPSQVREWLMTLLSSPESVELHDVFSRVDLVLPLISIITATILLPVSARISSSLKSFSYSAAWIYACCDLAENISLLSLIHTPSLSSFALQHEDAVFTPLLAIRLTKFVAVAFFVLSYLLSLFF